jgi:hypothetical protein
LSYSAYANVGKCTHRVLVGVHRSTFHNIDNVRKTFDGLGYSAYANVGKCIHAVLVGVHMRYLNRAAET